MQTNFAIAEQISAHDELIICHTLTSLRHNILLGLCTLKNRPVAEINRRWTNATNNVFSCSWREF
jgi:hypothetical protein